MSRGTGDGLTGPQKAAALLAQMDAARADRVLRLMSESEVIVLMHEIAQLPALEPATIGSVVAELHDGMTAMAAARQGGPTLAKRMLEEALGADRARDVMASVLGGTGGDAPLFGFLDRVDPSVVAGVVSDEHPQVGAVVLAHLDPATAAQVLQHLDPDLRTDVVRRISRCQKLDHEAVKAVDSLLDRRFSVLMVGHGEAASVGGVQTLVDVLNNSERAIEKHILAEFQAQDPDLAEEVSNLLFSFEDVCQLDDVTLQKVLRRLSTKELAVALRTAAGPARDRFLRNLSERAGSDLLEEIELLGPTRVSLVENAQLQIAKVVRSMEADGEIVLLRNDEQLVE